MGYGYLVDYVFGYEIPGLALWDTKIFIGIRDTMHRKISSSLPILAYKLQLVFVMFNIATKTTKFTSQAVSFSENNILFAFCSFEVSEA